MYSGKATHVRNQLVIVQLLCSFNIWRYPIDSKDLLKELGIFKAAFPKIFGNNNKWPSLVINLNFFTPIISDFPTRFPSSAQCLYHFSSDEIPVIIQQQNMTGLALKIPNLCVQLLNGSVRSTTLRGTVLFIPTLFVSTIFCVSA